MFKIALDHIGLREMDNTKYTKNSIVLFLFFFTRPSTNLYFFRTMLEITRTSDTAKADQCTILVKKIIIIVIFVV